MKKIFVFLLLSVSLLAKAQETENAKPLEILAGAGAGFNMGDGGFDMLTFAFNAGGYANYWFSQVGEKIGVGIESGLELKKVAYKLEYAYGGLVNSVDFTETNTKQLMHLSIPINLALRTKNLGDWYFGPVLNFPVYGKNKYSFDVNSPGFGEPTVLGDGDLKQYMKSPCVSLRAATLDQLSGNFYYRFTCDWMISPFNGKTPVKVIPTLMCSVLYKF